MSFKEWWIEPKHSLIAGPHETRFWEGVHVVEMAAYEKLQKELADWKRGADAEAYHGDQDRKELAAQIKASKQVVNDLTKMVLEIQKLQRENQDLKLEIKKLRGDDLFLPRGKKHDQNSKAPPSDEAIRLPVGCGQEDDRQKRNGYKPK